MARRSEVCRSVHAARELTGVDRVVGCGVENDGSELEDLGIGERSADPSFEDASDISLRGSVTQKVKLHFLDLT